MKNIFLFFFCISAAFTIGCSKKLTNPETQNGIIDLTVLSSTMVYAEVYNITAEPDDYLGKTIKVSGLYYNSYYEETDTLYHFVFISDAAACCAQGLEFKWHGDHVYPDDYPAHQSLVEVTGVFDKYDELGETYYYLNVDNIATQS